MRGILYRIRTRKKQMLAVGTCFLAICMLVTAIPMVSGATESMARSREVVRVAFYELDGFFEYDGQGNPTGYGVAYLEQLAKYGDFTFEYVHCDSWSEAGEKLVRGEVDIRMPVSQPATGETRSDIQFSTENIMSTFYTIMVPKSREDLFYGDSSALINLKLGYADNSLRDNILREALESRVNMNNLVEFDDINDCRKAMEEGNIDGMVTNIMDLSSDLKIIDRFYMINNYIVTLKDNPLMERIDEALSEMKLEEPSFQTELYYEYYPDRVHTPFTKEESQYLSENPVIQVGVIDGLKPLSYYDSETNSLKGIAIDLLEEIAQVTGLQMEYIRLDKEPQEALLNGEVDIVVPFEGNSNEEAFFQTKTLFDSQIVCVTLADNTDMHEDAVVGVFEEEKGIIATIEEEFGARVEIFGSITETFAALRHGDVNAVFTDQYIAEYEMNNPRNTQLVILHSPEILSDITIVGMDNETLQSILNKGIQRIGTATMEDVIEQNILYTWEDMSIMDFIYVNRLLLVGLLIGLFMVAGIFRKYISSKKKYILEIEAKSRESEAANLAKTEFLSRMSHEIRTPMNAVIGLASMGAKGEIPQEEMENTFSQIQRSGRFLLSLINDILDMSKIESGKIELNEEPINLEEWYLSVINMVQPLVDERHLTLRTQLELPDINGIYMDEMRMKQIVVNLLTNAIKFSQPGTSVTFKLSCTSTGKETAYLIMQVADEGCGMSQEFQEKMFNPFEQEESGFVTKVQGTGLGLSIVKRLVDQMGGLINCDSRLNEGTIFTIEMDRRKAYVEENAEEVKQERTGRIQVTGKVLLAEDNDINAVVAEKMLSSLGFECIRAKDGSEAVKVFESYDEDTFQIVLMDIRMPVMDGLRATAEIRKLDSKVAREIPIIALTADAFDGDRIRCMEAGMNDHLAKPLEVEELKKLLEKWCGGNRE